MMEKIFLVNGITILTSQLNMFSSLFRSIRLLIRSWTDYFSDIFFTLFYRNDPQSIPAIEDPILLESATNLAEKIRRQQLHSVDVIQSYISRIEQVNQIINAVVEQNFEEALTEAKKVDELIASGIKNEKQLEEETPLLGVPITIKETFTVKGLVTSCGLVSRKGVISEEDADVVKLLRKAGAIILGHTNVSELCMWWETHNYVYGRTNNPYNTNRTVGGSSGGEGGILAAAGSVIGIGSDIAGSIRMPCFFNGVFGHKPSSGIVSNRGHLPDASDDLDNFLTVGPMCRYATDLALVFKVLAGNNVKKLKLDAEVDVNSLRFFYMENDGGSSVVSEVHPEVLKAMRSVVEYLELTRKIRVTKIDLLYLKYSIFIWTFKVSRANAPSLCEELADRKGSVNTPFELIKWFLYQSNHTLPLIALGIVEKFLNYDYDISKYFINLCDILTYEMEKLLGNDGVFLFPTHPRPAPFHFQPLCMPFNSSYTAFINVLGFPSTHCPIGLSEEGLPVGIQVIANKNNDHLCLAVARELENAFGGWVSPSKPSS